MKKITALTLALLLLLSLLSACAPKEAAAEQEPVQQTPSAGPKFEKTQEKNPEPEPDPAPEPEPEPEDRLGKDPQPEPEPDSPFAPMDEDTKRLSEQIRAGFDERVFDESLELSHNPGLLSADDVTGPFFGIFWQDGSRYIPDVTGSDPQPPLPEKTLICPADDVPEEYLALLGTGEKRAQGQNGVYALLEYLGYGSAGKYNSGTLTIYYHRTLVSFYSYETGELVGWRITHQSRSGPNLLKTGDYGSDGQRPILKFSNGSIWTDEAWTRALDELFYDENGYQVVGTRLLSVPAGVDPIVVPEGVTEIADQACREHTAAKAILPEGLIRIDYLAFFKSAVKTFEFPSTLRYADLTAFYGTPWWEAHENDDWLILGGVLMKAHARGDTLTIPDGVKYVMLEALAGLECRTLIVPETVEQLCGRGSSYAYGPPLTDCESLETLILYGGLNNTIGLEGFRAEAARYCKNLKTVVVACELESIDPDWLDLYRDTLETLTIYCDPDSPAAQWASDNGVQCEPLDEYQ